MGGKFGGLFAAVASTAVALAAVLWVVQPGPEPVDPVVSTTTTGTTTTGTTTTGTTAPTSSPAGAGQPDPSTMPRLGVQFHGTWTNYTTRERERVLDRIEESGATWVRLDVGWAMLQPRRGSFDRQWAVPLVDTVMDQLRKRGLKVLVMFWLTPNWATFENNPDLAQYTPPDRAEDYVAALRWAGRRWGDVVDAWEVWNEPNLESFFIGTDPATYTRLLCRSYPAIRRADPGAKVVFGGLMFNDDAWLERAYDAGVRGCFDVLSVHSYQAPADAPPTTTGSDVWNLSRLTNVHQTMLAHRDGKPIWITEFGWSAHDNDADTEPWRRGVTTSEQATYAVQALELLARDHRYVKAAFWYKDAVNDLSTDEHQEGYALLDENLRPRPVYTALRRLYGRG